MIGALLLALPWLAFIAWAALGVKEPLSLSPAAPEEGGAGGEAERDGSGEGGLPRVSVVVPARNEAREIVACLDSLAASDYPRFEIIVVDDRSDDGTASLARSVPPGNADRIAVIAGEPLPEGWFGKPWACNQGAREARGELLLFTDADTRHGPDLLRRAVRELGAEPGLGGLSALGRQILGSFWERVVMPQVLFLLLLRFRDLRAPPPPDRCLDAIASGQHILVRREAYEAVGGHEAVKGEVVEDLRLGQALCRAGTPVALREAEDALATRMYRSLGAMVAGWSKNLYTGMRQSVSPRLRPAVVPGILGLLLVLWVVPPTALAVALAVGAAPGTAWGTAALVAVLTSAAAWAFAAVRFGISPAYALTYPLGAAVTAGIILRSWIRGGRVEWKGRAYG